MNGLEQRTIGNVC